MPRTVVLLSIPALRSRDLGAMPRLLDLTRKGLSVPLRLSGPGLTCPVQATLTTGVGPGQHGVIADSLYSRDKGEVQVRAVGNEVVQAPHLWETLKNRDASLTSAVWFAPLSLGADFICTTNPDGGQSLPCNTHPPELYDALRESLGHFPLPNFREPQASLKSTAWIVDSFVQSVYSLQPRFSFVRLPHLDAPAQRFGPDSPEARNAVAELDMAIGALIDGFTAARIKDVAWLVASEYCMTPVSSAGYPNRALRDAGILTPVLKEGREQVLPRETPAFAIADHQLAHIYVREADDVPRVTDVLRKDPTVAHVLIGDERATVGLNHPRSGEVVLIAQPDSWFADDWWTDDALAPEFPGTPNDATLVKGSHGSLDSDAAREGILVSSDPADWFAGKDSGIRDIDVKPLILNLFGLH